MGGTNLTIRDANREILVRLSTWLQGEAKLDPADVTMLTREYGISETDACLFLIAAYLDLDLEQSGDAALMERYLRPAFSLLDPRSFQQDPYRETVRFPSRRNRDWSFETRTFAPYECFVRDDLMVLEDGREIPQIGMFREPFTYPVVLQNDREWMTLAPVEIESMKRPVEAAHGNVLTLGLGLGYYAFHVSRKADVSRLTIVERERPLIDMFREEILPQFPAREKIQIVEADAFTFLEELKDHYDMVFCDIWHDAGDGADLYLRLREYEKRTGMRFMYWIENLLRQQVLLRGESA